jgi:hypothetical protein
MIHGLEILMQNNIFQFGDTFWHQKQGTAMGTPENSNPQPVPIPLQLWT